MKMDKKEAEILIARIEIVQDWFREIVAGECEVSNISTVELLIKLGVLK